MQDRYQKAVRSVTAVTQKNSTGGHDMKKFISAALIFLLCALLVCAVGEDDPVAVRVGDKIPGLY